MLHALGYFRAGQSKLASENGAPIYTEELVTAVDAFRKAEGLTTSESGSPPGLVDRDTVAFLWTRLEEAGKATAIREQIKEITAVTR